MDQGFRSSIPDYVDIRAVKYLSVENSWSYVVTLTYNEKVTEEAIQEVFRSNLIPQVQP